MIKLFFVFPLMVAAGFAFLLGGALLLPLLGAGIGLAAVALAIAVLVLVFRVLAAVMVGIGGLVFGGMLFGGAIACVAVVLALGAALAHLLVPLLVVLALVWLIKALSRPVPPAIGRV